MTRQSNQSDEQRHKSEDAFCQYALTVGVVQARRQGLDPEDCQDCALEFVERMLLVLRTHGPSLLLHRNFSAWLAVCAHHHACNFRRWRARHRRPCLPLEAADETLTPDHHAGMQNLEADLGRNAFWQEVGKVLAQMSDDAAAIFLAHYRDDVSMNDLASAYGRTPEAIKNRLSRSRSRVRQLLEQEGGSADPLRELLEP